MLVALIKQQNSKPEKSTQVTKKLDFSESLKYHALHFIYGSHLEMHYFPNLSPTLLSSNRIQGTAVSMHSCKTCKFRLPTASFAPFGLNHSAASEKF